MHKGWTCLLLTIALIGCAGTRTEQIELNDPDVTSSESHSQSAEPIELKTQTFIPLQQAKFDLGLALAVHSEWMVYEESISSQPISLSQILLTAEQHYENDNLIEGERLALLVSKFARLAFQQHVLNQKFLLNGKNLYGQ